MITLLVGENSFEVDREIGRITAGFDGVPERFDGAELELRQLPDLLMGVSLFAEKRLVIIRGLGQNKAIWEALPDWLGRLSDDIELVLVEPKPDKRTRSWKALQKAATVREFKPWGERDTGQAEKWVAKEAAERSMALTPALVRLVVARVGVDQWALTQALEKLSVLDEITEGVIREVIEASPSESVFDLFETALRGDYVRLQEMISTLSRDEDPYKLFGLLSGQVVQLAALAAAREGDDVARDIGAHPFALSRLRPHAKSRGAAGTRSIVEAFAAADEMMKTSAVDPWLAIEQALVKTAQK